MLVYMLMSFRIVSMYIIGGIMMLNSGEMSVPPTTILDARLKAILENVKLLYLLEREGGWDTSQNWEDILSLGEQQRLGMVSFT